MSTQHKETRIQLTNVKNSKERRHIIASIGIIRSAIYSPMIVFVFHISHSESCYLTTISHSMAGAGSGAGAGAEM